MEKMESVLRRFHLIKEPRESDARQQLKRELFAFNKVQPPCRQRRSKGGGGLVVPRQNFWDEMSK